MRKLTLCCRYDARVAGDDDGGELSIRDFNELLGYPPGIPVAVLVFLQVIVILVNCRQRVACIPQAPLTSRSSSLSRGRSKSDHGIHIVISTLFLPLFCPLTRCSCVVRFIRFFGRGIAEEGELWVFFFCIFPACPAVRPPVGGIDISYAH